MKGGKRPPGYTIIEVMIVLAISGVMFLIAATFISGKQERTAFTAGVNDMASNIQDTIEQVTDGQYSDIPLTCTAGTSSYPTFSAVANSQQGTQYGCVFLGKFFHFAGGATGTPGSPKYEIFSLAGNRLTGAGNPAINLSDIWPVPIASSDLSLDLTTQQVVPQNLDVIDVTITYGSASTSAPNYGFGFIQSQGALNNSPGLNSLYAPGAQTVGLVYDSGLTTSGMSEPSAIQAFQNPMTIVAPATTASVCLTDGTRYATIDVGATTGNGDQLSANVTFKGTTPCS